MAPPRPWPARLKILAPPADGSRRAQGGRRLDGPADQAASPDEKAPLISYVTVVRNAQKTLARTLQSVQAQTWPRVEHIVIDGLSDDGTLAIIEAHHEQIDLYYSEADAGLYDALNKAISLASGDLICVLNADDWLTPDAAQVTAQAHVAAGPAQARLILSAALVHRGDRIKVWSPGRLDLSGYLSCANVCHNGVYATPGAYAASGPYDTQLRIAADTRWLLQCVDAGVQMLAIETPTVHYSMGGMSSNLQVHTRECAQILQQRFDGLSEQDTWTLMHAFHAHRGNLAAFRASRPAHLGRALDDLARRHAHRTDFMTALALAGMQALQHPEDTGPALKLSRGEKARRSLRRRWTAWQSRLRTFWPGAS